MSPSPVGEEKAHATKDPPNSSTGTTNHPTPDPKPMYKAKVLVSIDGEERATLCDTGCERTCVSERFLRRHPKLYDSVVQPFVGNTISIDGSKVETTGILNIPFRINGRHLRMSCRIVRNLVYDFILGWDFFSKYKCSIHPSEGHLKLQNDIVNLIPNSIDVTSSHFSLVEDAVIPPLSKMITQAAYFLNPADKITPSDTVEIRPLEGQLGNVAVGRAISRVNNGSFAVELVNPFDTPITVRADNVLGHVTFTNDEEVDLCSEATDIVLSYGGDDSGYESEEGCASQTTPTTAAENASQPADTVEALPTPKEAPPKPSIDYSTIAEDAKPHLDKLKDLLEVKHAAIFSTCERDRGKTDLVEYHAHIKPGPPISLPAYRTTPEMQAQIDQHVHEMLADGLVSHSTSSYAAPVLMVRKKLGGWRFVTDFRKLNARCERVVYPLPRIEDSLRKLKKPRFFSTMDLTKGFWQIPIAQEDRKYFAFSTGTMHVEYNVMPMGALNSSATMQALMALILRGLPAEHIICFLDDILVASATMEDHILHLDLVLGAIRRAGLKLNAKKCLFAQESVSCLGHRLGRDGISPDPHNLNKIEKWKPPRSRTEVRQFLGLTGYYRQMIAGYASIASPLTNLTKLDTDWKWTDVEQKAFETLKNYLTSDTIMAYPDFSRPFWVKADASGGCVGFVLTQKYDKKEKVIAYGSKKLTETQQRYSTYDKEFFGILTAVRTYSHYLRQGHFYVVTDHRPLLNLRKIDPKTDATGRRVRWSIELNLYDFEIMYKKGKAHSDADAMSRLTDHDDYAEEEEFAANRLGGDATLFALLGMDVGAAAAVELIASDDKRKLLTDAQDADFTIREVKDAVRRGIPLPKGYSEAFYTKYFNRLTIIDGTLFRKAVTGSSHTPTLQAIIPPSLVDEVLRDAHGGKFAGHPGYRHMCGILLRHVVWPGIFVDTKKFVTKCQQCDIVTQPNPPAKTELQSIDPEYVFQHVCCDLIQLPVAPGGWKYICVFMDVFSRHVSFYKLKDKSTLSFTRALEDYVAHVGCPHKLSCDNGAEFCSELVEAVTKIMGIKKRTSVVYRPQSQGMVERMNREIIDQLTKLLLECGTTWPEHMHYVALLHNSSVASRTGESPNMVFFGRELPIPAFSDLSVNTIRSKSVREYVEKMKPRAKLIRDSARLHTLQQSAKTAEAYNRKAKHTPHQPGDLVYYKEIPKNRTKLDPKWTGPVEVVKRHANAHGQQGTTYTLRFKDGNPITRNYEQLKPAKADFTEPICKASLPLAPAPRLSCQIQYDSDDEDKNPEVAEDLPIASRLRRTNRPTTQVSFAAPERPPPIPSTTIPALRLPTRTDPDDTVAPLSSSSNEESTANDSSTQLSIAIATDNSQYPTQGDSINLSWDTAANQLDDEHSAVYISGPAVRANTDAASTAAATVAVPNSLAAPAQPSRPSSSRGTTPDPSQDTVIRVTPPQPSHVSIVVGEEDVQSPPISPRPPTNAEALTGVEEIQSSPINPTPRARDTALSDEEDFQTASPDEEDFNTTHPTSHIQGEAVADHQPLSSNYQDGADAQPSTSANFWTRTIEAPPPSPPSSSMRPTQVPTSSPGTSQSPATQDPKRLVSNTSTGQEDDVDSPHNISSLENFFDIMEEELQTHQEGKTDVLVYQGYEFTREHTTDRKKHNQYWRCRHKRAKDCNAKLTLRVKDLDDITKDSTVDNFTPHNHAPKRLKSYGTSEVSILHTSDTNPSTTTNVTTHSNHAISRISEGEFAQDFDPSNLDAIASSSPALENQRQPSRVEDPNIGTGSPSLDLTTLVFDITKPDALGRPIRRFVECRRENRKQFLNQYKKPAREDDDMDSSDE